MSFDFIKFLYIRAFPKYSECEVLFVRHDNNCGYKYEGKKYSPLIDSIAEVCDHLGIRFLMLAKNYSKAYGDRAANSPYCYNLYFLLDRICIEFFRYFVNKKDFFRLNKRLRVRRWEKVLKASNPYCVIAIQPDKYLCLAGHRLGVKVYDFQHGVISSSHNWYGQFKKMDFDKNEMPYGVICWDDSAFEYIKNLSSEKNIKSYKVSNPWILRFCNPSSNDDLVNDAKSALPNISAHKNIVVVSLQWGLRETYYSGEKFNGLMCQALVDVINESQKDILWYLRLHPVQMDSANIKEVDEQLMGMFGTKENVFWRSPSIAPLPAVLSSASLHITDMSSVVIEASMFGVRSAILSPHVVKGGLLGDLFESERSSGIASTIEQNPEKIKRWIEGSLAEKPRRTPYLNSRHLIHFLNENCRGSYDKNS